MQLWMFATPIVYPFSAIPQNYKLFASFNPMTSIVEIFKLAFLGSSSIELIHIIISLVITIFVFLLGYLMFNKMEKNFMDTV